MARGKPLIALRLDPIIIRRLRMHSSDSGKTVSDIVRDALALYFEYEGVPEFAPDAPDDQIRMEEKGDG